MRSKHRLKVIEAHPDPATCLPAQDKSSVIGSTDQEARLTLQDHARLDPAHGQALEQLAALARQAFGDDAQATEWLLSRHPMLGQSPVDLVRTGSGLSQVERLLHNIEHDLPA